MGTKAKKQFLNLEGTPLLGYALKILDASHMIGSIVVVVSSGDEEYCRTAVVDRLGIKKAAAIVSGGKERQDSVYNGLLALSHDTDIVVVHDGARPFFSSIILASVI